MCLKKEKMPYFNLSKQIGRKLHKIIKVASHQTLEHWGRTYGTIIFFQASKNFLLPQKRV